jgi:trehalose/maltose hydrolase-like predicted phosphorylase
MGWRGALYAWESADNGDETTPSHAIGPDRKVVEVKCGQQEQHISADVAYAVWQYWQGTGDDVFLCDVGAEILLETARFWSSRAQPEADGRCHIRGVIGPDEYHESIDDNAFTNVMARWNIQRALDVAALLRARWPARWTNLSGRLCLHDGELEHWRSVAMTITTGFDPETGLFEEFAGYFFPRRNQTRRLCWPFGAHRCRAWPRAHATIPSRQAGRRRCAFGVAAG